MKRKLMYALLSAVVTCIFISGCSSADINVENNSSELTKTTSSTAVSQNDMESARETVLSKVREEQSENNSEPEQENAKMKIQIGDRVLTATLEDNESAAAFQELIKQEGLSIRFSRYGGFEQVGSIGTSLPRNDVQTTTKAGDIVLYSGNQLVMFYGSNSWAYTRIGKFDSTKDLEDILGKEDITATFTLE